MKYIIAQKKFNDVGYTLEAKDFADDIENAKKIMNEKLETFLQSLNGSDEPYEKKETDSSVEIVFGNKPSKNMILFIMDKDEFDSRYFNTDDYEMMDKRSIITIMERSERKRKKDSKEWGEVLDRKFAGISPYSDLTSDITFFH